MQQKRRRFRVAYVYLRTIRLILPIFVIACYIPSGSVYKYYACQTITISERTISNRRYRIGYRYACQTGATIERPISNRRYRIGYRHACQTVAISERILSNRRYRIAYRYACQTITISERIVAYCFYTVGDNQIARDKLIVDI